MSGTPRAQPDRRDAGRERHHRDARHPERDHQLHAVPRMEEGLDYDGGAEGRPGAGLRRGRAGRRRAGLGRAGQGDDPRQRRLRCGPAAGRHACEGITKITPDDIGQAAQPRRALQADRPRLARRRSGPGHGGTAAGGGWIIRWPE